MLFIKRNETKTQLCTVDLCDKDRADINKIFGQAMLTWDPIIDYNR